jgi:hypothetical protein
MLSRTPGRALAVSSVDLLSATQDAVFDAINAPALTALGPVFTNVPENQKPPFTAIGAIDAERVGTKDGGLERHTVEIEFQHRGQSKIPLFAMMHAARTLLEAAKLTAAGALLQTPIWQASATDREDDGQTYHGIHRFELFAQPDDD